MSINLLGGIKNLAYKNLDSRKNKIDIQCLVRVTDIYSADTHIYIFIHKHKPTHKHTQPHTHIHTQIHLYKYKRTYSHTKKRTSHNYTQTKIHTQAQSHKQIKTFKQNN